MSIINYQPAGGLLNFYGANNRYLEEFDYLRLKRFLLGYSRNKPEMANARYNRLFNRFRREHPKLGARYLRSRPLRFKRPLPPKPNTPKLNRVGTLFERAYNASLGTYPFNVPGILPFNKYLHYKAIKEQKVLERARERARQENNARRKTEARKNEAARRIQSVWKKSKRAANMRNMNQIRALLTRANRLAIGTYHGTKFNDYQNLRRNLSNYTMSNNVWRALREYRRTGTVKFYGAT